MTIRNCVEKKIKNLKSNQKNKDKVQVNANNFTKSYILPWVFFTLLKLYK